MATEQDRIISVALSRDAKSDLDQIVNELGMKQKTAAGRILAWFVRQDRHVQLLALGQLPGDENLITYLFCRQHGIDPATPEAAELHAAALNAASKSAGRKPARRSVSA